MLWFPFGRLYKQINDGRYERILQFLYRRLPLVRFQKLVQKTFRKFLNELVQFNKKFENYISHREDPDYQAVNKSDFYFFNEYNFKVNDWLEELVQNFMKGNFTDIITSKIVNLF